MKPWNPLTTHRSNPSLFNNKKCIPFHSCTRPTQTISVVGNVYNISEQIRNACCDMLPLCNATNAMARESAFDWLNACFDFKPFGIPLKLNKEMPFHAIAALKWFWKGVGNFHTMKLKNVFPCKHWLLDCTGVEESHSGGFFPPLNRWNVFLTRSLTTNSQHVAFTLLSRRTNFKWRFSSFYYSYRW